MALAALVPLVVGFSNGLTSAAAPRLRPVAMMSGRPSLWETYRPGNSDSEGGTFSGSDTESTRDSSPPLPSSPPPPSMRPPSPWSQPNPPPLSIPRRERGGPAAAAPVAYADILAAAPAATEMVAGSQESDNLRTFGLLGAALAFGVAVFALNGDTSALDSLAAYAADDSLSADLVPSFSLIFLSEIGDKTFFIAALLAARTSKLLTFAGCASALALMTVISVAVGQIFHAVPASFTRGLPIDDYVAVASFLYFGVKVRTAPLRLALPCHSASRYCTAYPLSTSACLLCRLDLTPLPPAYPLPTTHASTAHAPTALPVRAPCTCALHVPRSRCSTRCYPLTTPLLLQSLLDAREIGISGEDNAGIAEEREERLFGVLDAPCNALCDAPCNALCNAGCRGDPQGWRLGAQGRMAAGGPCTLQCTI